MTDFTDLIDVAAERLGGAVLLANDEFFAPKEALLRPHPAEWREGVYTERGKWMDGWETRRRRDDAGDHDWCLIRLGVPAVVRGLIVDTAFFRGNFPEACAVDGCRVAGTPDPRTLVDAPWKTIVARTTLAGDTRNAIPVQPGDAVTHLRFRIYPDGGVARLRVHGDVVADPAVLRPGRDVNLAAMELGAYVVVCSDMFFGHRQNLILPGRSTHMGDGWETKRRRGPGHDWSIVRLAGRGAIERIEIDTDHYKGNAPGSAWLDGCDLPRDATADQLASATWRPLLARTLIQPHARHVFEVEGAARAPVSHVRLSIHPDGGVARLRLFGRVDG